MVDKTSHVCRYKSPITVLDDINLSTMSRRPQVPEIGLPFFAAKVT
jgi:hypothetical protein